MKPTPVLDENGHVKLDENGNVIYDNSGKQIAYDLGAILENQNRVNAESAGRRKDLEALTAKLEAYGDIDPEKARAALEIAANLDSGKLIEAGKVEDLKASIGKSYEATIADLRKSKEATEAELTKKLGDKDASIRNLLVKGLFESSTWLREKTHLDPDTAFNSFGGAIEVAAQDGKFNVVGKLGDQPLFSVARPGTYASGDELIELLVGSDPAKPFMRTTPGGSGAASSSGRIPTDKNTMSSVDRIAAGLKARGMGNG